MDYNVAFALIGYFFIGRPSVRYNLDQERTKLFVVVVTFSLVTDIVWIAVYSEAAGQYDDSNLPELTGINRFSWVLALCYFFFKLPFIAFLASHAIRADLAHGQPRAPEPELGQHHDDDDDADHVDFGVSESASAAAAAEPVEGASMRRDSASVVDITEAAVVDEEAPAPKKSKKKKKRKKQAAQEDEQEANDDNPLSGLTDELVLDEIDLDDD